MFVELAARTHFSFLRGGSSPRAVMERAKQLGYDALGIADCDGLYGMVRALEAADELGVRLIVGCELAIDPSPGAEPGSSLERVFCHVENRQGYKNLCTLLSESHDRHRKGQARKPEERVPRNQFAGIPIEALCGGSEGLWCLAPPCGRASLAKLRSAFGSRLSIAVWRHLDGDDDLRVARAESLSRDLDVPVCATNRVLFAAPEHKPVYDVLHCIREGVTLDDAGRALLPNAEAHLKSEAQMMRLFGGVQGERAAERAMWLARSREIAEACRFSLRELEYRFPSEVAGEEGGADAVLRRLTYAGAADRYPQGLPDGVRAQIEKELALIAQINVAAYFLSVEAIIQIARSKDILCQGRGSAANSAVCFCLGITAVDPSRSNLLFERFLSAERNEPPDIDVDFEHERREEVIQEIYRRYGRDRAAMVSEVIAYRGKSALREVGKVFGLSLEQVDRLSSLVSWWDSLSELPRDRVAACGFDPGDARVYQVLAMARAIQGYPRHLSIHVGGFVLSAEPLVNVAPIEPATMPGRTVIPWDKDDLDTLGFFKIDVLGLGMLTAIRKALDSIGGGSSGARKVMDRFAAIPSEDPLVYEALCAADTVGVFQIESRAQMAMLPRLRPKVFYDLVVEVAIVRPGPIQGGMVHPYLKRRSGKEPVTPIHPCLTPILERTLGVPLFQEQVMQIAIAGAGYTGGEADQLRRDMAAWRRTGKLERHREKLLAGFEKRGIAREFGERLYKSIEGFGEYGFPESHAASFALLVYASAWLKVHHAAAFAASLVNSQPMGFYSNGSIMKDAERHGVDVLAARVDASDWDCTLEGADPPAVRLGLRLVKGLGEDAGKRIAAARRVQPFAGVEDLVMRAELGKRELESLAHAGALVGFGLGRREAIWKVRAPRHDEDLFSGVDLDAEDTAVDLPELSRAEQLVLDYSTTGVAVGDHAMKVVRGSLPASFKSARDLETADHGSTVSTAGMVICRQRPGTASGVVFVTLEDETGFVNLILWPKTFERWRFVATTSALLIAHGKVERDGSVVYVVPDRLERLSLYDVPSMSRDFR